MYLPEIRLEVTANSVAWYGAIVATFAVALLSGLTERGLR